MTDQRILFDYTTLVSAANVINCGRSVYPSTTQNPYLALLAGRGTPKDSPMWLEVASFADLLESIVIHDVICVIDIDKSDRNREFGRYVQTGNEQAAMIELLRHEQILEELSISPEQDTAFQQWLEKAIRGGVLITSLVDSLFELLKQPPYAKLPDLFSHSQTVYKFDGETIWTKVRSQIDMKELSRLFRRKLRESATLPLLSMTSHFYPEDILGFFIRGLYYNDVAKAEGIPYHPHCGRSPIVMSDGLWAVGAAKHYGHLPVDFVQKLRREAAIEVNSSMECELIDLDIPPILAAVLQEARHPEECISVAIQLRKSSEATAYRRCLQAISASDSGLDVLKLKAELETLKQNLRKELGLEKQTTSIGLWKFSFPVKVPEWMFKSFYLPGKRHIQFLKDLAMAVTNIRSLEGKLIEVFRRA